MESTLLKIKKEIEKKYITEEKLTFLEFVNSNSYNIIKSSKLFDEYFYLNSYPDVKFNDWEPIKHYLYLGFEEYCNPNKEFSTEEYIKKILNPEKVIINPLVHYILYGFYNTPHYKQLEVKYKVSVIMPTFNRKNIISSAIDSVINQTFKNFELIIIDDGSTDGTESYIHEKYEKYIKIGKIKFVKSKHEGVSAARNIGLKKSTGNVIAYLDSDNIWNLRFLSIMIEELDKQKNHHCAYCGVKIYNRIENSIRILNQKFNRTQLLNKNFIDINSFIHEKKLYLEKGGFDEKLTRLVDWDLIIRYTENNNPIQVNAILVDYIIDNKFNNITLKEPLNTNMNHIKQKYNI